MRTVKEKMGINIDSIDSLPDGPFKDKIISAQERDKKIQERQRKAMTRFAATGIREESKGPRSRRNKYKNHKVEINGIKFDSTKEGNRYSVLLLQLKAGEIKDLKLQHTFTLQEGFMTPSGERIQAIRYKADFTYYRKTQEGSWEWVIEDTKGFKTDKYILKKKMMAEKGYRILET